MTEREPRLRTHEVMSRIKQNLHEAMLAESRRLAIAPGERDSKSMLELVLAYKTLKEVQS